MDKKVESENREAKERRIGYLGMEQKWFFLFFFLFDKFSESLTLNSVEEQEAALSIP